jgi:DNA-binding transcriptional LysR family regulator
MNHSVDIRQLRYFVAVAEELHFGKAAKRLHMEQPPLSQQIQRLERNLGCKLFERKPKVALTEAGKTLLGVARRTISQVNRGLEMTRQVGRGGVGSLSIGFAASAILGPLPEIIRLYRKKFPEVMIRLQELTPAEEIESIRANHIDLGLVRERDNSNALKYEIIVKEPFGVLLPPNHPLSEHKKLLTPEMLVNENFVHFPRETAPTLYEQIAEICRSAGFTPQIAQETSEWLTEVSLVEAGLGVAIVPASVGRLKLGGVAFAPLDTPIRSIIALCYLSENIQPTASAFLQIAREFVLDS